MGLRNWKNKNLVRSDDPKWTGKLMFCINVIFIICAFAIVIKIIYLQYFWEPVAETYEYFGNTPSAKKLTPSRGNIYSHDGKLLAGSANLYQIKMDCTIQYENWQKAAEKKPEKYKEEEDKWRRQCRELCDSLSAIYGKMSGEQYYNRIISLRTGKEKGRKNWKVGGQVDYDTYKRVISLPLFCKSRNYGGLIVEVTQTREYPYGALARKAIGKVANNATLSNDRTGIEGKFNSTLHGSDGMEYFKKTDNDNLIPDSGREGYPAKQGCDVRTTLDMAFQAIADKALRKSIEDQKCVKGGCVIIMDVKTGAIRAMANLTRQNDGHIGETYNWAVLQCNNPGSVMKTVTLTAAIDDGYVDLNTMIPTFGGHWVYHKTPLIDEHVAHYLYPSGYISVGEGLKISANHVFQYIAGHYYEHDPKAFIAKLYEYKMLEQFDFDINGLSKPICNEPGTKLWNWSNLPQMGTGYSINVTPLHLVTFYNAIANKGRMMKPYMVESIERDGQIVEERGPVVLNGSICKPETAELVTKGLLKVTQEERGTAYSRMKDCKIKVAGKTGTAFYAIPVSKGGDPHNPFKDLDGNRERQCTFAGFFPADNPEYTAIVALFTGRTKEHLQGTEGATVLKNIINELYLICPQWQESLSHDGRLLALADEQSNEDFPEGTIPDLRGRSLSDAIRIAENLGYRCEWDGTGAVKSTEPAAGAALKKGSTVKIVLGK